LFFLVIIFITGLIVQRGFFTGEEELPVEKILKPSAAKKIEINFQVLQSPLLGELQYFEEIAPFKEKTGRENPFMSY